MGLLFFLCNQLPQAQSHKLWSLHKKAITVFSITTSSCTLASHGHFNLWHLLLCLKPQVILVYVTGHGHSEAQYTLNYKGPKYCSQEQSLSPGRWLTLVSVSTLDLYLIWNYQPGFHIYSWRQKDLTKCTFTSEFPEWTSVIHFDNAF